jgi:hypothetical protein
MKTYHIKVQNITGFTGTLECNIEAPSEEAAYDAVAEMICQMNAGDCDMTVSLDK